ncbi:GFA family protein [Pelagibacteraceae bacterium]|nr:GFA family protein [Pelagibacteraceae bacterium]|tara:strand:- start:102 stop:464 length:363 start_codon:yes stop_codon:yes gene_type:complete
MKKLTCHCGQIEAQINITENLQKVLRCNCSICKRKGAIMSMVKNENFKIIKGKELLKLYQFHTNIAKHYFCSNCGIYTHHNPRSNPTMTGFNVGCIDDIDIFKLENISTNDGLNHPLDKK